jgi:plastocyanin
MNKYLYDAIQVQGTPEKPENPKTIGAAIRVQSWKVIGDCHLNLSSLSRQDPRWQKSREPAVPITGNTGAERRASVPQTSNESVGETTPPDYMTGKRVQTPGPQPGQPPVAEDEAQNPADADRIAVAAQRAEIGTHNGTIGVAGDPGSGTRASEQAPVHPAAVVNMVGEHFQPEKVTISAGQTVEWVNTGGDPHTVTVEPDKALVPTDATLPKNAQPFDSGTISAGMTFSHTFKTPGTYRYFCTLHEGNGMVGEVIVK